MLNGFRQSSHKFPMKSKSIYWTGSVAGSSGFPVKCKHRKTFGMREYPNCEEIIANEHSIVSKWISFHLHFETIEWRKKKRKSFKPCNQACLWWAQTNLTRHNWWQSTTTTSLHVVSEPAPSIRHAQLRAKQHNAQREPSISMTMSMLLFASCVSRPLWQCQDINEARLTNRCRPKDF